MQTKRANLHHYSWLVDLIIFSFFFLFFYTLWLGHYPLFNPDESRYAEVAREMLATKDFITPRVNGVAFLDKPILYYWLQVVAMGLMGVTEFSIRFFPMLFGLIGCVLTYFTGRCLFNRRTALLAAIILATSPLYFASAHYANLDLEISTLISATLFSFIIGVQSELKQRHYFLFATYIFAALAFLTKGMIGIVFPSVIIACWLCLTRQWNALKQIHLLKGLCIFSIIVLPWYFAVQKANPNFFHYFFITQQISRYLSAGEFNNKTSFWFYIPVFLISFFPWSIFIFNTMIQQSKKWWNSKEKFAKEIFFLIWPTFIFLFFSIPHSKIITYLLPIFPPLALLTALSIIERIDQSTHQSNHFSILLYTVCTLILSIGMFYLAYHHLFFKTRSDLFSFTFISGFIFLSSSFISIIHFLQNKFKLFIITAVITNILFLLFCTYDANQFNRNTTKPLLTQIQSVIQPEDQIVNYRNYFYDVPLYLESDKPITVVSNWQAPNIMLHDNWKRELWLGMSVQKTTEWLMDEKTFWQHWNSQQRLFVFINVRLVKQFQAQAKKYFLIDRYKNIILLSNQPLKLEK